MRSHLNTPSLRRNASKHIVIIALLVLPHGAIRGQGIEIKRIPVSPPTAKIAYGSAPQQFAQLRVPPGDGPFPVVVTIHGGCWAAFADLEDMASVATALTLKGFATWNVEYRRGNDPGGGWPNTFEDSVLGATAVSKVADRYHLDLKRMVILGHSAGGQLALYVASRWKKPGVSLAGIVDMEAYAEFWKNGCVDGELAVMGGTPEEHPERYSKVSPKRLLPLGVPQILIWGERDGVAPESVFRDYEKRADHTEIVRVPGVEHFAFAAGQGPAWNATLAAVNRLTRGIVDQ